MSSDVPQPTPPEPTTIREYIERIRDVSCEEYQSPETVPSFEVIRQIYSDAVAALALLDAALCVIEYSDGADLSELAGSERIIPDPKAEA